MTADYCDLTEAYNKIVTECYPAREAEIKIRCSKYFSEYCKKKKIDDGLWKHRVFQQVFYEMAAQ